MLFRSLRLVRLLPSLLNRDVWMITLLRLNDWPSIRSRWDITLAGYVRILGMINGRRLIRISVRVLRLGRIINLCRVLIRACLVVPVKDRSLEVGLDRRSI